MAREERTGGGMYFLLDSNNQTVARGMLRSPEDDPTLQVKVLDDKISDVMRHEQIRLVSLKGNTPAVVTKVSDCRRDTVVLERLYTDKRKNLRVPTQFRSFIYPLNDTWRGRRRIKANDISCGGVAFFCEGELRDHERLELVVPVTTQPLILQCEVLRQRPSDQEDTHLYALQFVDMCDDEEAMVREATFSIQLENRPKHLFQED